MTVEELKNMNVEVKGYGYLEDYYYGPDALNVKCKMSEALNIMKECVESLPMEIFYRVNFLINEVDGEHLFSLGRELDDICIGRDNIYGLTKGMIREALGMEYDKSKLDNYRK